MNRLLAYLRKSADADSTDRQLLDRFTARRDEAAFAALVRRHGPLVWGVCRRNLSNPADAEDAFQATFLVLVRRAAGLAPHVSVGPWLHRVAVWCCRNVRRANRRRLGRVRFGLPEPVPAAVPGPDPDLGAALDAALLALPEKHRTAVVLCHLQGWTRRQAAAQLGCPEGTLSALLSRALTKLRAKLADRDPAAVLAVAGALAAPPAVSAAAIRAAFVYTTATGAVSPTVLSAAEGVLRMFWVNKLRFAAAGIMAVAGLVALGAGLTARPAAAPADPPAPAAKSADVPTLAPGKWALIEWLAPTGPRREAVLTVAEKDGKPVVTAVEGDTFQWTAKDLAVSGRHVRMTLTREGPLEYRFDGLFDATDPTRVLGSLAHTAGLADRVTLELVRTGRPLPRLQPPAEYLKWVEQEQKWAEAQIERARLQKEGSPAQQVQAGQLLDAARKTYIVEVLKLMLTMVAEPPDSAFGYEAAEQLFSKLDVAKPTAAEVESWAKVARTFAAKHGPQFESATLGGIAGRLSRHAEYTAQARAYAAEADKLATDAGIQSEYAKRVAAHDEERAAWATQSKPPAAGAIWTATLTGKVTDAKGQPIPDAEVLVNNTQWVKTFTDDESYKATTGRDGRYAIALRCQGEYRLHVTQMWAEKRGFVRAVNEERHKLLPGQSATVDFTLAPGEPFGGTLKLRSGDRDEHVLYVKGLGVNEAAWVKNGEKFELTLPPGTYTVELPRGGGKKLAWAGLTTGKTDYVFEEPPFQFTPETVGAGFDQLWKAMDRNYSYFTLKPDVDWAKLRDEYRPKAIRAKSADELAAVLKEMLGRLKDGHVWIMTPDGKQIGTHRTPWTYNGSRPVILDQLTDTTQCGNYAVVGKTKPDGFGYFLMTQQSAATPALVAKAVAAIEKLADAPAFIIDLRNANGGSEPLAQEIARLFCEKKTVYAKSKYRNGAGHDEFTEDYPRDLQPAKSGKPYLKPVVCLLGPGCVSSGEGFAKMMAALPHVTTVGLPTRGSSGNPGPVEVGETGLTVYFSRWVDLLPDGTPIEGKGVPPAVRVEAPAEAYKDADPTLAKGLEVLRVKAAAGGRPK